MFSLHTKTVLQISQLFDTTLVAHIILQYYCQSSLKKCYHRKILSNCDLSTTIATILDLDPMLHLITTFPSEYNCLTKIALSLQKEKTINTTSSIPTVNHEYYSYRGPPSEPKFFNFSNISMNTLPNTLLFPTTE